MTSWNICHQRILISHLFSYLTLREATTVVGVVFSLPFPLLTLVSIFTIIFLKDWANITYIYINIWLFFSGFHIHNKLLLTHHLEVSSYWTSLFNMIYIIYIFPNTAFLGTWEAFLDILHSHIYIYITLGTLTSWNIGFPMGHQISILLSTGLHRQTSLLYSASSFITVFEIFNPVFYFPLKFSYLFIHFILWS